MPFNKRICEYPTFLSSSPNQRYSALFIQTWRELANQLTNARLFKWVRAFSVRVAEGVNRMAQFEWGLYCFSRKEICLHFTIWQALSITPLWDVVLWLKPCASQSKTGATNPCVNVLCECWVLVKLDEKVRHLFPLRTCDPHHLFFSNHTKDCTALNCVSLAPAQHNCTLIKYLPPTSSK